MDTGRSTQLAGRNTERAAGRWSARFVAGIGVAYAVVMVAGFASMGNVADPLPDPYLAVAEVLILLMAPTMVVLMAAVHACAPARARFVSLVAFGWMLVTASTTMTVHVVELTVARRIDPAALPGAARLFDLAWPSMLYAIDIVAWDLFLGLSLLFAACVFAARRYRWARWGLAVGGVMCLVGLVGPAADVLAWRGIGIAGYAVVFPLACVAVSRAFSADVAGILVPDELVTSPS